MLEEVLSLAQLYKTAVRVIGGSTGRDCVGFVSYYCYKIREKGMIILLFIIMLFISPRIALLLLLLAINPVFVLLWLLIWLAIKLK